MTPKQLTPGLSVSPQLSLADVGAAQAQGFRTIIVNRPDGEEPDQPTIAAIRHAAGAAGLGVAAIPVTPGKVSDEDIAQFADALRMLEGPVLAYCRTGTRSATLWALAEAKTLSPDAVLKAAATAGYDLSQLRDRLEERHGDVRSFSPTARAHDVLIVGGGAAGIATAASLLARRRGLDIAIIEPREEHYYQPGWTLVGGGVFDRRRTQRSMASVMPKGVTWIRAAAAGFRPEANEVVLEDGTTLGYRVLVAAPGVMLDWAAIDGLEATLGRNGVTSNYRFDMAPYTWELIQGLREGVALFTQPPMPIKCAGAPQKAMYLASDFWRRNGRIGGIDVGFNTSTPALFGVKEYVAALMEYVDTYGIDLQLNSTLVAVDGEHRRATFRRADGEVTIAFDMMHVTPPQRAPHFIAESALAASSGFVDVDQQTLRHSHFGNVFGLGDGCSAPNAKTAAAARKQAPVVAVNALAVLDGKEPRAIYDGYGSCPLTVERGKIVLAEFGYGGVLQPSFPKWLVNGERPSRLSWLLKEKALPWIYWNGMLKGHEWLAKPEMLPHAPTPHASAANPCGEPVRRAS
ncbi:bifunctional protein tyrosine phosphatase family protein/NAD(P)/FAD-dependent oxidoreductase [Sphingomonas jeddahensis]|uniref:Beta-lactamase hydrolase-like protein n=1 Tax=Sphingomonas jeddahensis TaxID=1915074 RepID=A0A1V2EYB0_9SPHN|nr:bifunctional protein tyrosine phosphatase family protein/NAD(P)/FAD-dependent oxidoreductase [Sphingomonas jeddahensis]ONF97144.1 Beta-lactamase hydrolase-like protein [Sphingomonas jeddahensis]